MRLERLSLQNFRGFESLELEMAPGPVTVLIGANGSGKTSVIRAASAAVNKAMGSSSFDPALDARDHRMLWVERGGLMHEEAQSPVSVEVSLAFADGQSAGVRLAGIGTGWNWQVPDALGQLGQSEELPAFGYLSAERRANLYASDLRPSGGLTANRAEGYRVGADLTERLDLVARWITDQHYVRLDRLNRRLAGGDTRVADLHPQLQAVEGAAGALVDGAESISYDAELRRLIVNLGGERIPFSALSDGYRALVGFGLGLVWQCVVLNPHYGAEAPQKTPGVVLIDELELHLHPAWQWTILERLQRVFPKVQFIVATHSAAVVAAAPPEAVRLLDGNEVRTLHGTAGRDVNGILEEVFGTRSRPQSTADKLAELEVHLEQRRDDDAKALLKELESLLGEDDPDLIRVRWTLSLRERLSSA